MVKVLKISLLLLSVFVIFLIASCATTPCPACPKWNWDADPYEPDVDKAFIVNGDNKRLFLDDYAFEEYTCFSQKNLIQLKYNISRMKIPRSN